MPGKFASKKQKEKKPERATDGFKRVLESYKVEADNVQVEVDIADDKDSFVKMYLLNIPEYGPGTRALLDSLKGSIISEATIEAEKMFDVKFVSALKERFSRRAESILQKELPNITPEIKNTLIGMLLQEMLGLGRIEFLLNDANLEEIVINTSTEPMWVYHRKYGWLKTNINIVKENEIQNYASIIARRVGKQITILDPLLDAHLITGDRANATLFPISGKGNTLTIRRFRREPWTVTDFIENGTATAEIMALVWTAMEYELNMIVSGGTASGKTSFLNICMPFIQPNHRIISIEDTRELLMPEFLHWVPLTTREPNPEGKGGVDMLDLLVNSLRMRPDRIIVGEVRRQREAEVMFEGMHTGHSVYTTVHADTAEETIHRLTNPPISIPPSMLTTVHLNVVMFRNRRLGVRRILQVAEYVPEKRTEDIEIVKPNILYRWKAANDIISKHADSIRLYDELGLYTGMSQDEINRELKVKQAILRWMVEKKINAVNDVGKLIALYYKNSDEVINMVKENKRPEL